MKPTTQLCLKAFIIIIRMLRVLMLNPIPPNARHVVDVDAQALIAELMKALKQPGTVEELPSINSRGGS